MLNLTKGLFIFKYEKIQRQHRLDSHPVGTVNVAERKLDINRD